MSFLKGIVDFVNIAGYSWTPTLSSLSVMVHGISSDLKNHSVLSPFTLPLVKLDLLGRSGCDAVERVFECVSALPGKRIAAATTDNGTNNMIKGM